MKTTEIRTFLGSLEDIDFRYLRIQISMANDARELIRNFNLSKEQFCELLSIKMNKYNSYIRGGYDYSVMDMAKIQAAYCKLQMEKTAKEAENMFTDIVKTANKK